MHNKELHDSAWKLLEDKGFKMGEMMKIRSSFAQTYKEDNPFIERKYNKGEVDYYSSTHDLIKSYMFKTENEVVLANAIYLNMDEGFGSNQFRDIFRFTCRIIGLNSEWANL